NETRNIRVGFVGRPWGRLGHSGSKLVLGYNARTDCHAFPRCGITRCRWAVGSISFVVGVRYLPPLNAGLLGWLVRACRKLRMVFVRCHPRRPCFATAAVRLAAYRVCRGRCCWGCTGFRVLGQLVASPTWAFSTQCWLTT